MTEQVTNAPDLSALSDEQVAALFAGLKDRMKGVQEAAKRLADERKQELGVLGADFFAEIIRTGERKESKTSDWVGYSESSMPFEVDGIACTASVTIREVEASKARKGGTEAEVKAGTADYVKKERTSSNA